MRSRDEVLREFEISVTSYAWEENADGYTTTIEDMADRIRELEAQQAASEPGAWLVDFWDKERKPRRVVVMDEKTIKHMGECVFSITPLYAHPSAAGVRVTEDDEKITMTVGPVTEAEAVAALKRHGWTEQASLFGSFRSLVAPEPAASEGASA